MGYHRAVQHVVSDSEPSSDEATVDPYGGRAGQLKRAGIVALFGLPIVGLVLSSVPICPTAAAFGVPCPGCGLTRATLDLLHGNLSAALHMHPLVLLVSPLYIGGVLASLYDFVRGPVPGKSPGPLRRWFSRIIGPVAGVTFALLLIVWLARFYGWFGGPAPVETFRHWATHGH